MKILLEPGEVNTDKLDKRVERRSRMPLALDMREW